MSKKRGLAGYGQVANVTTEQEEQEVTQAQEVETKDTGEVKPVPFDLETPVTPPKPSTDLSQFYQKPKTIEKKQVSIYLDTDVIEAFNEFGKENGKGAKSDLVNNFLKQVFNIRQ